MVTNSPRLHHPHWLKMAERLSLLGAGLGAIATAISQQVAYVYTPMALFVLLKQHRFNQLAQKNQTATTTELQHHFSTQFSSLEQRIEQLEATTASVELNAQTLLSQQDIAAIIANLKKLQRQQQLTEQTLLPIQNATAQVQNQLTEVQQWLTDLDTSTATLHDQTRDLDQLQKQLTTVQQALSTKPKPRLSSHRGRVAIFIDSANLDCTARALGIKIDYEKLISVLAADSLITGARFYIGVDPDNERQQGFLSCLRTIGYRIVDKPIVQYSDGTRKANVDVELALDMVEFANCYDTAILVSGDGDFIYAVNKVKWQGARVEVVSWRPRANKSLIATADRYIDMEKIKDKICQPPYVAN